MKKKLANEIGEAYGRILKRRLYGLRKYKKQIERDEEIAKELQNGNQSIKRTDSQNQ